MQPQRELGYFHKQSELWEMLPLVGKLHELFDLFVVGGIGQGTIELVDVTDCLRAMGRDPCELWVQDKLAEYLSRCLLDSWPKRVNFELLLTLYLSLASLEKAQGPSAEEMVSSLRLCDATGTGTIPYSIMRRLLTTRGERLSEAEVFGLLNCCSDVAGNVYYERLIKNLWDKDEDALETLEQVRIYLQAVGRNALDMDMMKRDEFIEALREEDVDKTGFIEPKRLLELFNGCGHGFSNEDFEQLTKGMKDVLGVKGIDYRRFLRFIMNEGS